METPKSLSLLLSICNICIVLFEFSLATSGASTATKFKQSTVFSYSTVNSTGDGPANITQLTIATYPDGKYHYVRKENGKTTTGIWEGPLPTAPDAEKIAEEITSNLKIPSELSQLSSEIDSSIQEYLNKAFSF